MPQSSIQHVRTANVKSNAKHFAQLHQQDFGTLRSELKDPKLHKLRFGWNESTKDAWLVIFEAQAHRARGETSDE